MVFLEDTWVAHDEVNCASSAIYVPGRLAEPPQNSKSYPRKFFDSRPHYSDYAQDKRNGDDYLGNPLVSIKLIL